MGKSKILQGLTEAVVWAEGVGTMRVYMPGQPARDMTFEEFAAQEQARAERNKKPAQREAGRV